MAKIHDLITAVQRYDPVLGAELHSEFSNLTDRRSYGLVWENHVPEPVEIPSMIPIKGDTARVLPPRGSLPGTGDQRLWTIISRDRHSETATLVEKNTEYGVTPEMITDVSLDDLVVVLEPTDAIYPGLVETGRVANGSPNNPDHVVIKGENLHALKALTFTHHHSIDVIYIDPPYNTGAKDWKYGNDYVDSTDSFRHSKFLSFLEKRLVIAKELLNPDDSVMIVTIDEKEYLNVGLLLKQNFPDARIQMITSVINPKGTSRTNDFSRNDEYIFFVMFGDAAVTPIPTGEKTIRPIPWYGLRRTNANNTRDKGPHQFYAIYVEKSTGRILGRSDVIGIDENYRDHDHDSDDVLSLYPVRDDGLEMMWSLRDTTFDERVRQGYVRTKKIRGSWSMQYLMSGSIRDYENGTVINPGRAEDGSVTGEYEDIKMTTPKTNWTVPSHNAGIGGSQVISALLGQKRFDYPKSLYAVEDALSIFVKDKKDAVVLDFFGGSGTTAHAVMRLNKRDNGQRTSITVTNNAVSEKEEKQFSKQGLRAGDSDWERYGICEYVTIPRITAAITGKTPSGKEVTGSYKHNDLFPMSDGIEANARFFDLSYERGEIIDHGGSFSRLSPLLWLRSGGTGEIITEIDESGVSVAESYAVVTDPSQVDTLIDQLDARPHIRYIFVITENDHGYESLAAAVSGRGIETVKSPSSYLNSIS